MGNFTWKINKYFKTYVYKELLESTKQPGLFYES